MITLYGRRNSSNVQRVIWALAELDLPYRREVVGHSFGGTDTPAYRALNPTGLVPTLTDDADGRAIVLWESDAILRYLAARYGVGALWPIEPADRARADQWMAWLASSLSPAFSKVFHATIRTPRAQQDLEALAPAFARLSERLRFLEAALDPLGLREAGHLGGPDFSYADIPFAILIYRIGALPMTRPETPALDAWYARVSARPAFQRHVALPMGTCAEEWLEHEIALEAAAAEERAIEGRA